MRLSQKMIQVIKKFSKSGQRDKLQRPNNEDVETFYLAYMKTSYSFMKKKLNRRMKNNYA